MNTMCAGLQACFPPLACPPAALVHQPRSARLTGLPGSNSYDFSGNINRCVWHAFQPGALFASKHAKLKGIHLPRTSHARLTLLGGVGWACSQGSVFCWSRGHGFSALFWHTDMPPVRRC